MIEQLQQHIIKRLSNRIFDLDLILASFEEVHYSKNSVIQSIGSPCDYVYFIAKGCIQISAFDAHMQECIIEISVEEQWCSDLKSFTSDRPAEQFLTAIEDTVVFRIHKKSFYQLIKSVPQFSNVCNYILEEYFFYQVNHIQSFITMNASERMDWIDRHRPDLLHRISSKKMASYLGVHKDMYSKLKKAKLLKK